MRGLALLSLLTIVIACSAPAMPMLDASPSPPDGYTPPRVEIGTRASGAMFTPWHDGDAIQEVWGPQGGVMITPAVAIDGTLVSGDAPGLDVSIQNYTLPDRAPLGQFPSLGPLHALFARLDTRLVNGPLFDQIGWSDMTGQRLLIRARVSGMGVDATGQVEIVIGAPLPQPDAGLPDTRDAG